MKRERGWTFGYPAAWSGRQAMWGPARLARLRLALGLLFPPLRWPRRRVADLPAPLRGVAWPAGVTPLGVYRDRAGETFVRLRGPADSHGQWRALAGIRGRCWPPGARPCRRVPWVSASRRTCSGWGRTPCWSWSARTAERWTSRLSPGQRRGVEGRA
ncbi:hypothetical protein [Deinococcus aquaticus]|uniref:hypothetical protein n=1 Tax=Deinococcus aquaticus TaxID=328692 RepID=UPI00360E1724